MRSGEEKNTPAATLKNFFVACENLLKESVKSLGYIRSIQDGEQGVDELHRQLQKAITAINYSELIRKLCFSDDDIGKLLIGTLMLKLAKEKIEKEFPVVRYVPTRDDGVLVLKKQSSQAADDFHCRRIINMLVALKEITELKHEAMERADMPQTDFAHFIIKMEGCIDALRMKERTMLRNPNFICNEPGCFAQCEILFRSAHRAMLQVYPQPANVNSI